MKKTLLIIIVSMGVLSSCVDHSERRKENLNRGQFKKRVIKPINGFVLTTFLIDTSFNVNDTILVNDNKVVIIR